MWPVQKNKLQRLQLFKKKERSGHPLESPTWQKCQLFPLESKSQFKKKHAEHLIQWLTSGLVPPFLFEIL